MTSRTPELYSLSEIHSFLRTERATIHGVSPTVYTQNKLLCRLLTIGAELHLPRALGLHLSGSRVMGISEPASDIDLVIPCFDTEPRVDNLTGRLRHAFPGVKVDIFGTMIAHGFERIFSTDERKFIHAIRLESAAVPLFEAGIHDTASRKLAALAAAHVIAASSERRKRWSTIRTVHAEAYLGNLYRMRKKLRERLGLRMPNSKILPADILKERHERFGLPKQFDQQYSDLQTWLAANEKKVQRLAAYRLCKAVETALSQ